jgi:hypothetical protein
MYLILIGSSLGAWLETPNTVTGLYPFMSMAKLSIYNLEDVYDAAMINLNNILQRKLTYRRDRNSKRMRRV